MLGFSLAALAGLVGLLTLPLVILLATPLHFRLIGASGDAPRLVAEVRTLWGKSPAVRMDLLAAGREEPSEEAEPEKQGRRKWPWRRKAKDATGGSFPVIEVLREVLRFLEAELSRVHLDLVRLNGVFGLPDPADTGRVFGLLTPVMYGLPCERVDVSLSPDFEAARLTADGEARLHLTPLALLWPVLRLALRLRRITA